LAIKKKIVHLEMPEECNSWKIFCEWLMSAIINPPATVLYYTLFL